MLNLATGNPEKNTQGASSTIFVLPFRYQLVKTDLDGPSCWYQSEGRLAPEAEWIDRKRYFTPETSTVLFEHAQRYYCKGDRSEFFDPENEFFLLDGNKVSVEFEAPEIILFEDHAFKYREGRSGQKQEEFFNTGFLLIKAYFPEKENAPVPSFDDLLFFNEMFRYWRSPFENHKDEMSRFLKGKETGEEVDWDGYLSLYLRRWQKFLQIPLAKDGHTTEYYSLFPEQWIGDAESWIHDEFRGKGEQSRMGWICYADNRAFVWSNAVIPGGLTNLEGLTKDNSKLEPESCGYWVKLLNVDKPWKGQSSLSINEATVFEQTWAKERTYYRWAHSGSLYGYSYHSGVFLSGLSSKDGPYFSNIFRRHYLDMTLLLLFLRMTIFRFSSRLTELTAEVRRSSKGDWEKDFLELRKQFAIFTNLYQFPLISNQQQMLELYQKARKQLDVDDLFKEVEEEIRNTQEYFSAQKAEQLNWKMTLLTWVGLSLTVLGTIYTLVDSDKLSILPLLVSLKNWLTSLF